MMKHIYSLFLICSLFSIQVNAQEIVGSWSGPIKLPTGDLPFVLNISGTTGNYKATADSPDQNAYGIPVDTVILDGEILRFAIGQLKVRFEGTFVQKDSISGDFVQSGATFSLGFLRVGAKSQKQVDVIPTEQKNEDGVENKINPLNEDESQVDSIVQEVPSLEESLSTDTAILAKVKSLEPLFTQVLKDYHAAGYAVAVVNKEGIVYSNGFGFRDVENKKAVTPNTLFAIGSATKAFTAALVGQLADQGKLSLDSPVVRYLPQLRFSTDELTTKATLRDLMSHRTGLPRYDLSWYFFPSSSRDSLMARIEHMLPSTGLREKWQYNNFMYLAQGMLVEQLSGKSWEKNIEETFFNPLGMPRSNASISDLQLDEDAALGYTLVQDSVLKKMDYYPINAMGPAGSINSSVNELANWVKLWLAGGEWEGKEILSKRYIGDAVSSQMVMTDGLPNGKHPDISFSNYGLGWMMQSYRGHYLVQHGGNIDGFSANVSFFPYDGLGIIVLSNQNGSAVPSLVRNTIADKIFELTDYNWTKPDTREVSQDVNVTDRGRVAGTEPSHALKDYEGSATHPAFGKIIFQVKNDSLFAKFPTETFWLSHYHYDVFEAKVLDMKTGRVDTTASSIKFNFHANLDGSIGQVSIGLEAGSKKPQVFEISHPVELASSELQKYVGNYALSGIDVKVFVKNECLYVLVPGQPEYKSIPQGNHKFSPEALPGYSFAFEANAEGVIEALYFVQPNGTFKASKK